MNKNKNQVFAFKLLVQRSKNNDVIKVVSERNGKKKTQFYI